MEDEEESNSMLIVTNTDGAHEEIRKKPARRRKLPEKGTKEYISIRKEDAKKRRTDRSSAHKCPHCEYTAPFPNKMRIHLGTNHKLGRFKCEKCCEVFNDYRLKRRHMRESHPLIFSCDNCDYTARTRADLKKHMLKIHTEGMKCTISGCNVTLLKRQLKKHLAECHPTESSSIATTTRIATFIHRCSSCIFTTSSFEALEQHLERMHRNGINCPFNDCDHVIPVSELNEHIENCHSGEDAYNLVKDETVSKEATPSHLDGHLLLEDSNDSSMRVDPEDCIPESEKDNTFDEEASSASDHLQRDAESGDENREGTFNCILCKGTYRNLAHLRRHIKRVHEKVYKRELPRKKKHKCSFDGCSKLFTTIGLLNDHLNVHNNITPYSCAPCKQHFHARARFAVHLSKYHQMSIKAYDDVNRSLQL